MSLRFAVVAEAPADHRTATDLADRVLVEAVTWVRDDPDQLPGQREWVTEVVGGQLTWKNMRQLAAAAGLEDLSGHFDDDEPGLPDARAARRAIYYLREKHADVEAVLLIRDQDNQPDRREGLEQARRGSRDRPVIVIGLAIAKREAWVLSGFVAETDDERSRLAAERQTLGSDPTERSHELTAGGFAKRCPKRVLRQLSGDNPDRERRCWTVTPLPRLRQHGGGNGLAAYLDEVRERLAPLIGHVGAGGG